MKVISTKTSFLVKGQWLDINVPTEIAAGDESQILALDGVIRSESELLDAQGSTPIVPIPASTDTTSEKE